MAETLPWTHLQKFLRKIETNFLVSEHIMDISQNLLDVLFCRKGVIELIIPLIKADLHSSFIEFCWLLRT